MKNRFPPFASLVQVYSAISVMIYGWSLVAFIWKLPSWINYLTVGEISVLLSYTFFVDLFESLFFLGILILICVGLPSSFLLSEFTVRGSLLVWILLGSGMAYFARYVNEGPAVGMVQIIWLVATLLGLSVMLVLANKISPVKKAVFWLTDQLTVFPYILVPLSVLATVVVLFRNLF